LSQLYSFGPQYLVTFATSYPIKCSFLMATRTMAPDISHLGNPIKINR